MRPLTQTGRTHLTAATSIAPAASYTHSPTTSPAASFSLREVDTGRQMPDLTQPVKLNATETTPVGIVTYSSLLQPGEEWTLDFKMPLVPISRSGRHQRHRPSQL